MTALHFFDMSICKVIYSLAQPRAHTHSRTLPNWALSQYPSQRSKVVVVVLVLVLVHVIPALPARQAVSQYICSLLVVYRFRQLILLESSTHTLTLTHGHTLCCIAALVVVARLRLAMENLCDFSCFFLLLLLLLSLSLSVLKWTQSDEQCFLISTKKLMANAAESGRFD